MGHTPEATITEATADEKLETERIAQKNADELMAAEEAEKKDKPDLMETKKQRKKRHQAEERVKEEERNRNARRAAEEKAAEEKLAAETARSVAAQKAAADRLAADECVAKQTEEKAAAEKLRGQVQPIPGREAEAALAPSVAAQKAAAERLAAEERAAKEKADEEKVAAESEASLQRELAICASLTVQVAAQTANSPVPSLPSPSSERSPVSAPSGAPDARFNLSRYYKMDALDDYGFADFHSSGRSFHKAIEDLVSKAETEIWKKDVRPYGGAIDLMRYHWKFTVETQPHCVKFSTDGDYAAYRTPLLSRGATSGSPIYAIFQRNKRAGRQPYFFLEWVIGWTKRSTLGDPPPEADVYSYTTNSVADRWWLFDESAKIDYEFEHILEGNRERLREILEKYGKKYNCDEDIAARFATACEATMRRIKSFARSGEIRPQLFPAGGYETNFDKDGNPQWFAQLLLPLCIHDHRTADAALALQICKDPEGNVCYLAKTMLTVDMAYWNTRFIAPVATAWLKDNYNKFVDLVALQAANENLTEELAAARSELISSRSSPSPGAVSRNSESSY